MQSDLHNLRLDMTQGLRTKWPLCTHKASFLKEQKSVLNNQDGVHGIRPRPHERKKHAFFRKSRDFLRKHIFLKTNRAIFLKIVCFFLVWMRPFKNATFQICYWHRRLTQPYFFFMVHEMLASLNSSWRHFVLLTRRFLLVFKFDI